MKKLYLQVWDFYGKRGSNAFIAHLRGAMDLHGITQQKLATRAGFDAPRVSRWFNGKVVPDLESRLILHEALDDIVGK